MNNWQEIFTAYQVAQHGTVTKASEELDVHRATVIRHIDSLEKSLGTKLFHRHSRGYTLTEDGQDLLRTADFIDDQLLQFKARVEGQTQLSGDFIITSLEFIAPILLPALKAYQQEYPKIIIHYLTSQDLFKLEYGQAHLAIRSGIKPNHPDYVVQPFDTLHSGLFAHQDYIRQYGKPNNLDELKKHSFLCSPEDSPKSPIQKWIKAQIPASQLFFQSNSQLAQHHGIMAGIGIGPMLVHEAEKYPQLIEVYPRQPDWQVLNWLVTHGDLHRSNKVQGFFEILKRVNLQNSFD